MADRRGFALLALALPLACGALLSAREQPAPTGNAPVIEVSKSHLDFRVGKTLFTRYHIDPKVAKPYFYPVYAAEGQPVTRAWPMENDPEVKKGDHQMDPRAESATELAKERAKKPGA